MSARRPVEGRCAAIRRAPTRSVIGCRCCSTRKPRGTGPDPEPNLGPGCRRRVNPQRSSDDERSNSVRSQGQRPGAGVVGLRRVHLRHLLDQPDHARLFIFSYCWYFGGNLATAVVVGGIFTIFEVIVYASLISAMPRAGGDYVWQSRILGRGLGFLLAVTGLVVHPVAVGAALRPDAGLRVLHADGWRILGAPGRRPCGSPAPVKACCWAWLLVCVIVFIYIAIGMKWYARVQKFCFWVGMVGLVIGLHPAAVRQQARPSSPA